MLSLSALWKKSGLIALAFCTSQSAAVFTLGSALGAWLGGFLFDLNHSCTIAFWFLLRV
jgi:predicted MFS family arabinose efflux permease